MNAPRIFDAEHYVTLNRSRGAVVSELVSLFKERLNLQTAADIGCGLGDFSKFLEDHGFRVLGIDGREQNVAEAKLRFPDINFRVGDAEDLPAAELGVFDVVLCFGLLYHLENPFRTIRLLELLTQKILFVEGMCVPGDKPLMELLDEGVENDQGLRYVAFYPSETCLIKMLFCAGFPHVYRPAQPPEDIRYRSTYWRKRQRAFLVASKVELRTPTLIPLRQPVRAATGPGNPWDNALVRWLSPSSVLNFISVRVPRFFRRPWGEKREILSWYMKRARNRK